MGMLLSIPLTMVAKIAMEGADETRWIAVMMGPGSAEPIQSAAEKTNPSSDPDRNDMDATSPSGQD